MFSSDFAFVLRGACFWYKLPNFNITCAFADIYVNFFHVFDNSFMSKSKRKNQKRY